MANQGNQGSGNLRDKAENTGANLGAAAGRKVGEAAERAQSTTGGMQKAQDTASGMMQKAQDTASNVAEKAKDYASTAAERASEAVSGVGDRMSSWGSSLRESAPREGMMGSAAGGVADSLEAGGRYLQQHNFSDMTDDLSAVIRQYPMQSLLVAFGVGCFLGMASRR
jgi:ElaB/YqjD/DUF883 family membrane-anchored ribosome-binding protein